MATASRSSTSPCQGVSDSAFQYSISNDDEYCCQGFKPAKCQIAGTRITCGSARETIRLNRESSGKQSFWYKKFNAS